MNHDHWLHFIDDDAMLFFGRGCGAGSKYYVPVPSGTLWLSLWRLSISY